MEDMLHRDDEGDAGFPDPRHGLATRLQPVNDQDPDAARQQAVAIFRTLEQAVQAERLRRIVRESTDDTFETLHAELGAYLEAHGFLRLQFEADRALYEGQVIARNEQEPHSIIRLLYTGDVAELLFKEGLTRQELARFLHALRLNSIDEDGFGSVATRFWEASFERIVFRCRDELQLPESSELEAFDLANVPHHRADELVADPSMDPAIAAATTLEDLEDLDVHSLPLHVKRFVEMTREEQATLNSLRLPAPDELQTQLAQQLIGVYCAEKDATMQSLALDLLGRLVDAQVQEKRFRALRGLLDWLGDRREELVESQYEMIMQAIRQRISDKGSVLVLGAVLDDEDANEADVETAREILFCLDDQAVDGLCRILMHLESVRARKLVCKVLATVGKEKPQQLARRAKGQPWFMARNMAYVLGRIGDPVILPHLQEWSTHEDARVRLEAARALGRVVHAEASTTLTTLLQDSEYRVRQAAVWSLAQLGGPEAVAALRQMLFEDREFRERPSDDRDVFFRAYGRLVDEAGFEELIALLDQRALIAVGWKAELRRGAAIALGESDQARALDAVRKHSNSRDRRLRTVCQLAQRMIRNRAYSGHMSDPIEAFGLDPDIADWEDDDV